MMANDCACPSAEDHRATCYKAEIYAPEILPQVS